MIEWSETDLTIRAVLREFIDAEIRPNLDALETGEIPPYDIIRKLFSSFGVDMMAASAVKELLDKERAQATGTDGEGAGESGGLDLSAMAGGNTGPISMGMLAVSELAGVSMGIVASAGVSLGLCASTIMQHGTLEQKERWLPGLATFDKIGAWAITEPDAGSDAFGGMLTTVRPEGDGWLLNGQKTFITNGPYADVIVVYAKLDTGDGTPARDRPVLTFVLDGDMEGLTKGKPFRKMGLVSSPTGELFFDDILVGPDRLLGGIQPAGRGDDNRDAVKSSFAYERTGVAALALGIINECHRLCLDYSRQRTLWGREIAQFQLIQAKLAEMEIARINVENMVFRTIETIASGRMPTLAEASAMKLYASRTATEVAMEAIQLFGGNGYMAEYRVEQLARDAKGLMIYAGSNEIMVTHIAKGLVSA